jgi:ribosomal protein L31
VRFEASSGKKVHETHSSTEKKKKLDLMMHTCHPSYFGNFKIGGSWSRPAWAKSGTLSPK